MDSEELIEQLQQENGKLQEENGQLRAENQQLRKQVEQLGLRLHELEGRLSKDSHNSSKPPSMDGYAKKTRSLRKSSGKKPGGQEGHAGSTRHFVAMPDEIIRVRPEKCARCQASLQELPAEGYERRQRIDLPEIKVQVTEYQALEVRCPDCQHVTRSTFPDEVRSSLYGRPSTLCWGSTLPSWRCIVTIFCPKK
jgi:hypothetical protein